MENSEPSASDKPINNSNESVWKNFKHIFPYLYLLVVIFSLLREAIYYSHFNIEIQDYIGVSELLLPVSNSAITIIGFILFSGTLLWLNGKFNKKKKRSRLIEQNEKWWKIFSNEISGVIGVLIGGVISYITESDEIFIFAVVLLGLLFVYPILSHFIIKKLKESESKNFNPNLLLVPLFLIVALITQVAFTIGEELQVRKGEYTGTKIYTKDSTYVSDSTHFYIGKTTNFYFIYNKDRKSSTIIPEREVNRFELKEN